MGFLAGCQNAVLPLTAAGTAAPPAAGNQAPVADAGSAVDAASALSDAAVRPSDAGTRGSVNSSLAGSDAAPVTDGGETCQLGSLDIAVANVDSAGYAPYALSGCALAYVAADRSLRLRKNIATADEREIAPAGESALRPSVAGPTEDPARVIAWESSTLGAVRVHFAGETSTIKGNYHHTGQPRVTNDAVVFTGWMASAATSDTDIVTYLPATTSLTVVGSGPGQQLFADISETQIAYSDFSEDPDGRFDDNGQDLADLVLIDRKTGAKTTHKREGKQAFPLLTRRGSLVYLDWASSHPEPKLSLYNIAVWTIGSSAVDLALATVQSSPPFVRPSLWDDRVEWVERPPSGNERLMRASVLGGQPAEVAFSMPGIQLLASVSGEQGTLMATSTVPGSDPMLRAVGR